MYEAKATFLSGDEAAKQPLQLSDLADVSEARFMESYESAHSDQSFTSRLARKLGVTKDPLRLDSQTKYGELLATCCSPVFPYDQL